MHSDESDKNNKSKEQKREVILSSDESESAWKSISERVLQAHEVHSDSHSEQIPKSLRPGSFADYIGQERIKENMLVACRAAKKRGEPLDHTLFHGPPGLGKTSLARIIANTLGVGFKSTSGPVIERAGDLAAILTSLQAQDVLFIDEIHRLPRVVEEVLYPALEDFQIDIIIGQGPAAKSIAVELKPFTLVAATTRTSLLTSPLRDRFGILHRLEYYSKEELAAVVARSAKILGLEISASAAQEIGARSRGTPRIANRLLRRVLDLASEKNQEEITVDLAKMALDMLEIDHLGLDGMDRNLLALIIEKFGGGPVGIETIAAAIGEERATIEDVYEPFLIQEGFLLRTRRGREVTNRAYDHLGFIKPNSRSHEQQDLLFGNKQ